MKNVLLGVTSSVACYKAVTMASILAKKGYCVKTVLTPSATRLISPQLFAAVTRESVFVEQFTDNFDAFSGPQEVGLTPGNSMNFSGSQEGLKPGNSMNFSGPRKPGLTPGNSMNFSGHIDISKWAEIFVIAPATANTIGKIANGICDNLLLTLVVSRRAPLVIAPAMESRMWENSVVKKNIVSLIKNGIKVIGPAAGHLASGDSGIGRMMEPEEILKQLGL